MIILTNTDNKIVVMKIVKILLVKNVNLQGRRKVFSFWGGGQRKKGHCNVNKGTKHIHADNYH